MQDSFDDRNGDGNGSDPAQERPKGAEGVIFDIARKAVAGSVRSLLSSEEGLRALIGALVPKEIGQTVARELATQLATLRAETVKAVVAELSRYLDRLDPAAEVQKILSGLDFDVHIKVGVSPKQAAAPRAPAKKTPTKKKAPPRKKKKA